MPTQPNILIIYTDQHRWDAYGATGNDSIQTPHLDRIARDGVLYENCFCPLPVCTPSRYSFLSGQYVRQHGGWTNHTTLPVETETFPRLFRQAGFATAAVGKMHFTPTYLDVGFERMRLAEQAGPGRWDDDYHRYLDERGLIDRVDMMDQREELRTASPQPAWDLSTPDHLRTAPPEYWQCFGAMRSDLPEAHHSTSWIGRQARDVLDGWDGGGNLLMVSFIKPHHPFDPPAPWDGMYAPDTLNVPAGWTEDVPELDRDYCEGFFDNCRLDEPSLRRVMAMYYATISQIDHQVGQILECLQSKGLYDDTLILFSADHGEYLGHHHLLLKGGLMYDPLVRIPLAVKYPGRRDNSGSHAGLFSNIDCAPTLLQAAGLAVPASMDQATDLSTAGRDYVFAEADHGRSLMVRTADHKLLHHDDPRFRCLFDLQADPYELRNQFDQPAMGVIQQELQTALLNCIGHQAVTRERVDEDHAVIDQPNVRRASDGHRELFYRQCLDRYRSSLDREGP